MVESNSCCMPVQYSNPSTCQQLYSWATEYAAPWSQEALWIIKIDEIEGVEYSVKISNNPSLTVAILKIVSYCLLLFLIIAEIIIAIRRCSYKLKIGKDSQERKRSSDETLPLQPSRIQLPAVSPRPSNIASPNPKKPKTKKEVRFRE